MLRRDLRCKRKWIAAANKFAADDRDVENVGIYQVYDSTFSHPSFPPLYNRGGFLHHFFRLYVEFAYNYFEV